MQYINTVISNNFKQLREKRKLSLDAVSKATGVSKSMLAQIERGEVSPTVVTLWKIANGLKVHFSEFLHNQPDNLEIVTTEPILEDEGRYRNFPHFPLDAERRFEYFAVEIDPGGHMDAAAHPPGTEEYLIVFDGELRLTLGGREWPAGPGQAVRFRANEAHSYANTGATVCRLGMVMYYPKE